jgi:hypothetical protein
MDGSRFDDLARSLACGTSRRGVLAVLLGLGAGLAGVAAGAAACPPGQVSRRGQCLCKLTGRPPLNGACPCPDGQTDTGDGWGCLACRSVLECPSPRPDSCQGPAVCRPDGTCGIVEVAHGQPGACLGGRVCCGGACTPLGTDADCAACGDACLGTGESCGGGSVAGQCGCTPDCSAGVCGAADGCGGTCLCPAGFDCRNGGCFKPCPVGLGCEGCGAGCLCHVHLADSETLCLDTETFVGFCALATDADCPAGTVCSNLVGGSPPKPFLCTRPCCAGA